MTVGQRGRDTERSPFECALWTVNRDMEMMTTSMQSPPVLGWAVTVRDRFVAGNFRPSEKGKPTLRLEYLLRRSVAADVLQSNGNVNTG